MHDYDTYEMLSRINNQLSTVLEILERIVPPCEHEWEVRRVGGDPTSADSLEAVAVCKKCGAERY